ncbi:melatonin receptor type 1B isoform X2 [Motacilla alba alba]|uniref:melatonin receptor type 1B isoform X2 n=1 Tax=Motacilla alba alba TaxID=1094192 RepID=UPI0018D4F1DB|nr:melatonin receptor type 1B isoform X2 [Motacilla alba alba]
MLENGSLRNCCDPGGRGRLGLAEREAAAAGAPRPAWVVPVLSSVLIFTTVVDILGNLLVILSVFKNRKLRNSGTPRRSVTLPSAPPLLSPRAPSCPPSGTQVVQWFLMRHYVVSMELLRRGIGATRRQKACPKPSEA